MHFNVCVLCFTESFHMSDSLEAVEEDVGATPSSTENHSLPTVACKNSKLYKMNDLILVLI